VSVALASLFDFVRDINQLLDAGELGKADAQKVAALIAAFDSVLGVIPKPEEEALSPEAQELIKKREDARKAKDWKTADAARAQLKAMGIILEDTAQGVRWKREKSA
jgi:cysteinyl-tRNA synthetase